MKVLISILKWQMILVATGIQCNIASACPSGGNSRTVAMAATGIALPGECGGANANPASAGRMKGNAIWLGVEYDQQLSSCTFSDSGNGLAKCSRGSIFLPSGGIIVGLNTKGAISRLNFGFCWNTACSNSGTFSNRQTEDTAFSGVLAEYASAHNAYDGYFSQAGIETEAITMDYSGKFTGIEQNSTEAGTLNQTHQTELNCKYSGFDFLISANIVEIIDLGLSVSVKYLKSVNRTALYEEADDPTKFDSRFHYIDARQQDMTNGTGAGCKAGIIVRPCRGLNIALCINSPYTFNLVTRRQLSMECRYFTDDSYSVLNEPNGMSLDGGITSVKVRMPASAGGGISWTGSGLTANAEYFWTNSAAARLSSDDALTDYELQKLNDILKGSSPGTHIGNVHRAGGGLEYAFSLGSSTRVSVKECTMAVRTGYKAEIMQTEKRTNLYAQPEKNSFLCQSICFGMGWNIGAFSLDLAAERKGRTSYAIQDIYFGYPERQMPNCPLIENKSSPRIDVERTLWRINCTLSFRF